jgi:putative hydrolase of the HAD superfamily
MFHPVLLSFEIGVKKPNLKSYQILLDQLKISPQQLLFIDNKEENVKAAKSLGIDAITFINAKQLAEELKKRGIILSIDNFNSLSTNLEAVK